MHKFVALLLALLSFTAPAAWAIERVQAAGSFTDDAANMDQATTGNVTAGNLLTITTNRLNLTGSSDPYVLGDCAKQAGTATLGTITMDVEREYNYAGANYIATAIYSAPITGTGSLTIRCVLGSNQYGLIAVAERSGLDVSGSRVEDTAEAEGANSGVAAPNSGDATSAAGALFVGALADVSTGGNDHVEDGAFTLIYEQNSTDHMVGSFIDRIVVAGTTDAASWTEPVNDNPWAAVVVVYKAATAAGGLLRRRRSN